MSNYYDLMKDQNTSQYFSYVNDKYIELNGPKVKVFKLDKKETQLDDLYGYEISSRIYLPPFDIRALYKTNPWELIMDVSPLQEKEENISFVVNLDRMVSILRGLKNQNIAEIKITYKSSLPFDVPAIEKIDNKLIFYVNSNIVETIDLTIYRSIKNVVRHINTSINGFSATYDINDEINNVDDFTRKSFKNETLLLSSKNHAFDNCTDVIEMGDLVLTDKWRLYEVKFANPTGDFGWNWATYELKCNLIELDVADGLPGEYRRLIEEHQYGLPKIKKE